MEFFKRTRVRLTAIYSAIFLIVAGVAAVAFWITFENAEFNVIDSSLRAHSEVIAGAATAAEAQGAIGGAIRLPSETSRGIAVAAVLVGSDGSVLGASASALNPRALAGVASGQPPTMALLTLELSGHPQRILLQPLKLDGQTAMLVLARPIDELQENLRETAIQLAAIAAILVIAASGLAYWLSGRALRPVGVMAGAAREISEHDLHRRIQLDAVRGDELGDLAATFNAMLGRLESSFLSLRQFTADASHELRAPLALMRTQVEVMLRHSRTEAEYVASHRTLLSELDRLSRTADQLLTLARADAGALTPSLGTVDLPDLMEETCDRWRRAFESEGVRLDAEVPQEGQLRADEGLVRGMLDNLLDNALRYAGRDGTVSISARHLNGTWSLDVSDSGPGVDPALRSRLFERFARADQSREKRTGGAGLGLALAATVAAVHGGRLELADAGPLGGATFRITLPADAETDQRVNAG